MITVKQLKEAIEKLDDDTEVWVRMTNYDGKIEDIATTVITIDKESVFIECTQWYEFDKC